MKKDIIRPSITLTSFGSSYCVAALVKALISKSTAEFDVQKTWLNLFGKEMDL